MGHACSDAKHSVAHSLQSIHDTINYVLHHCNACLNVTAKATWGGVSLYLGFQGFRV